MFNLIRSALFIAFLQMIVVASPVQAGLFEFFRTETNNEDRPLMTRMGNMVGTLVDIKNAIASKISSTPQDSLEIVEDLTKLPLIPNTLIKIDDALEGTKSTSNTSFSKSWNQILDSSARYLNGFSAVCFLGVMITSSSSHIVNSEKNNDPNSIVNTVNIVLSGLGTFSAGAAHLATQKKNKLIMEAKAQIAEHKETIQTLTAQTV